MKSKKIIAFVFLFFITLLIGVGAVKRISILNRTASPQDQKKLRVVTSFYPLYFFASQVGGDKVDVTNITPAGAEPHDYEPTTQDMIKIESSNLLVLNGSVEAWGNKVKDNLVGKNVRIVTAGEGILTQQLSENGQTVVDPHVWLSPQLAKKEVDKIAMAFVELDPNDSAYFQTNTTKLKQKLDQLDQRYRQSLAACQGKDIITSHAAFGYLATAYGLTQVPIAGLSPDEEPSPKQMADVVKFAKAHHATYIFFESLVSPKLSETIASEVGAKTLVLDPLEGIRDADIRDGKDYFSVMQDNLTDLQIALRCTT